MIDLEKALQGMDPHQRPLENIPLSIDDSDTEILSEDSSDFDEELEFAESPTKRQKI